MKTDVRAAVLYGRDDLRVERVRAGELTGEDLYVRVERCGVCGSDAGLVKGKIPAAYPAIIGHEIVGTVESVGPGAEARHGVRKGDRIVLEFPIRCGNCWYCITGEYRLCDRAWGYGGPISITVPPHLWGGMAEFVYVGPYSNVHKAPADSDPEVALLACAVLGNGIRWTVTLGHATVGSSVVILGAGPQGLACVVAAREAGARAVVAVGRQTSTHRLELAKTLGATGVARSDVEDPLRTIRAALGDHDADVIVDTTGSTQGLQLAIPLARKGGRVVVGGQSGEPHQPIPLDLAVEHEITIVGANSHDLRAVEPALEIIASRRYPLEAMVTHRFPLSRAKDAILAIRNPDERAVKVVVDPSSG